MNLILFRLCKITGFWCDINVPDNLTSKFSEMQPIFNNIEVTRQDLSEHMKGFCRAKQLFELRAEDVDR